MALVVPGGVDRSGEVRVIPALLALLTRLGRRHDVQVFALRQEPLPGQWELCGCTIHNLAVSGRLDLLRAVKSIVREHRRQPFDLVQTIWSGDPGLVGVLAARWLGLPSFVHLAGGELADLPGIGYGGRQTWRSRWREDLVLRLADALSAASAPMLDQLRELRFAGRRIPLGVDLQAWPPLPPRHRQSGERLRLVHVASLNRVKDQATLLHAMRRLAQAGVDFELDVVGEDTLRGEIQALATTLDLDDRVRFHGFATQAALRSIVVQAHLLVMTSLHEAGPLVVLEAAVLGIPCVGTRVGHIAEWEPEAAIAVPVSDDEALAEQLAALANEEARRLELARTAQARAIAESADRTAELFEELHRQGLAAGM
ncbi:glycosyltransferase family 4 protein [Burkholderiaceae bacterium UC74_6]